MLFNQRLRLGYSKLILLRSGYRAVSCWQTTEFLWTTGNLDVEYWRTNNYVVTSTQRFWVLSPSLSLVFSRVTVLMAFISYSFVLCGLLSRRMTGSSGHLIIPLINAGSAWWLLRNLTQPTVLDSVFGFGDDITYMGEPYNRQNSILKGIKCENSAAWRKTSQGRKPSHLRTQSAASMSVTKH